MLVRVSVTAYYVLILAACFSFVSVGIASVHVTTLLPRSPKRRHWLAKTHGLGASLLNWLSKPLWGCRVTTSPLIHSQLSLDMEADASIRQEVLRQLIEPSRVRSPILSRGRFIMMCNHLSSLDGIVLRGLLHPIAPLIVYKSSLHYVPLLGMNLYLTGDFPVYFTRENGGWKTPPGSGKQLLQNMKSALDENIPVLVFPEGQRNPNPSKSTFLPFRQGTLNFAIAHEIPILPVAISGTDQAWPIHSALLNTADVRIAISSTFIHPRDLSVEVLTEKVEAQITSLLHVCE